jgi:hypothetical protein
MERKIGDIAIPKDFPILQSEIASIQIDLDRETPLYILKNGGRYTENELKT